MKYFFYFVIALGAVLYFPRSRAVITDVAEPVLTPVLRWGTKNEVERIVGDLQTEVSTGRGLPQQGDDFQRWLRENYQGESSRVDSWDAPYVLQVRRATFQVVSGGPDGQLGTGDDISVSGRLEGQG